jgi:hypothetical protein
MAIRRPSKIVSKKAQKVSIKPSQQGQSKESSKTKKPGEYKGGDFVKQLVTAIKKESPETRAPKIVIENAAPTFVTMNEKYGEVYTFKY